MHAAVNPALYPLMTLWIHFPTGSALPLCAPVSDRPFKFFCVYRQNQYEHMLISYLIYEPMQGFAGHQLVPAAQHRQTGEVLHTEISITQTCWHSQEEP